MKTPKRCRSTLESLELRGVIAERRHTQCDLLEGHEGPHRIDVKGQPYYFTEQSSRF